MLKKSYFFLGFVFMCCCVFAQTGSTITEIKNRGYLKCGVSTGLPGFSYIDGDGNWQGFDVDFCRAIAASILGDGKKVEFSPLDSKSRFAALAAKEIDVLIRNTTWNFTREASLNILFPAVTFYDGQSILVSKSAGVKSVQELEGASICVMQGTTSELNLSSYFTKNKKKMKPIYFDRSEQMIRSYQAGRCDAMTSDRSQLYVLQGVLKDPDQHEILDEIISKEPLAPVVRDNDPDFFKLVRWVVFSSIQAEEWDLTAENYLKKAKNNPDIRKFLGMSENVAESIGLPRNFVSKILLEVGNYGEIYARNLGEKSNINIERGRNDLWIKSDKGLMYAMPSR
ncbi:MAG: amino acid ABC transporter substrate-binding protein [Pseudomonadota bacterium]|nr:amino acid ABC transporter substrate-binding protein [Pseudomonadota bacterium]